jgi:hypothetical protein
LLFVIPTHGINIESPCLYVDLPASNNGMPLPLYDAPSLSLEGNRHGDCLYGGSDYCNSDHLTTHFVVVGRQEGVLLVVLY